MVPSGSPSRSAAEPGVTGLDERARGDARLRAVGRREVAEADAPVGRVGARRARTLDLARRAASEVRLASHRWNSGSFCDTSDAVSSRAAPPRPDRQAHALAGPASARGGSGTGSPRRSACRRWPAGCPPERTPARAAGPSDTTFCTSTPWMRSMPASRASGAVTVSTSAPRKPRRTCPVRDQVLGDAADEVDGDREAVALVVSPTRMRCWSPSRRPRRGGWPAPRPSCPG